MLVQKSVYRMYLCILHDQSISSTNMNFTMTSNLDSPSVGLDVCLSVTNFAQISNSCWRILCNNLLTWGFECPSDICHCVQIVCKNLRATVMNLYRDVQHFSSYAFMLLLVCHSLCFMFQWMSQKGFVVMSSCTCTRVHSIIFAFMLRFSDDMHLLWCVTCTC